MVYIAAKEEAFGFFNLTETNLQITTTTLTKDESNFLAFDCGGNLY